MATAVVSENLWLLKIVFVIVVIGTVAVELDLHWKFNFRYVILFDDTKIESETLALSKYTIEKVWIIMSMWYSGATVTQNSWPA